MEESIENIALLEGKKRNKCFLNLFISLSLPFLILLISLIATFQFNLFSKQNSPILITILIFSYPLFKNSLYVKVCDIYEEAEKFEKGIKNYIQEMTLTFYKQNKSIIDLEKETESFLENYKIDLTNTIFYFLALLSLSLLSFVFIDVKSFAYSLFFSLAIINWNYFLDKKTYTKLKEKIIKIKENNKELFWNQREIEKYKILQNEYTNFEIQRIFEKVFTPEFLENFQRAIKKEIEILFDILKKEKNVQKHILKEYLTLLEKIDSYEKNNSILLKNIQNTNLSFEKIIKNLSKEIKILNAMILGSFETINESTKRFQEKNSKNIEDLNMHLAILNKNFDILESIFSQYQKHFCNPKGEITISK